MLNLIFSQPCSIEQSQSGHLASPAKQHKISDIFAGSGVLEPPGSIGAVAHGEGRSLMEMLQLDP